MSRIDNNYFTYRETPTTENGTGTLVDIKGQTLKWNQLIASNETVNLNRDSARTYNISTNSTRSVVGHKYYFATTITSDNTSGGLNCRFGSDFNAGKGVGRHSIIFTANDTNSASIYCYIQSNEESGTAISFKDSVLFDLTIMGIDSITSEEFASLFPLNYYPYNSGSLIPFNGNGIKTTPNIANVEYEQGAVNSSVAGNTYESNKASNTTRIRVKNLIYNEDGKTYSLYFNSSLFDAVIQPYDSNGLSAPMVAPYDSWKTTSPIVFTATGSVAVAFRYKTSATITADAISQIKPIMYKEGEESVLNLPISTYFPTGMKEVNNGVYDELTESKAITRVGAVDMGTMTWIYDPSYTRFYSTTIANLINKTGAFRDGLNCVIYEPNASPITNQSVDKTIAKYNNGNIYVVDRSYTDATAFTNSVQGKYLYFELATYTETDVNLDLTFNIDAGGTEELLPSSLMNGSVDLGSLTWTLYGANNHEFTAELPNMKVGTTNASIPSLGANAVANYSQWVAQRPNDSLYKDTNGKLHLRLNPYETVEELTSALQGVYLWYETTDSTPTTTPILCDIFYRGLIPVSVTVYPLGAGTVEGAGQYRYGETVTLVAESSDGIYRFLRYEDENGDTLSTNVTYSFIAGE